MRQNSGNSAGRIGPFIGIPALWLGNETSQEQRACRLLGMKANQIVRATKECSNSIYRHAAALMHHDIPDAMSRTNRKAVHASIICGDNRTRRLLLEEHAKAAFSATGKPERIPVLEYALLAEWNEGFSILQRGGYAPNRTPDTSETKSAQRMLGYSSGFFPSYSSMFLRPFHHEEPWRTDNAFHPYWLSTPADLALANLRDWAQLDEASRARLAGAAFAIASAASSRYMLLEFLELQPELGYYYQGILGLERDVSEPWDGRKWTPTECIPEQAAVTLGLSTAGMKLQSLSRSFDLSMLSEVRELLEECEATIGAASAHALDEAVAAAEAQIDRLNKISEALSVTGLKFDFAPVKQVLCEWISLLGEPVLAQPSPEQSQVIERFNQEATILGAALDRLRHEFDTVHEQHASIVGGQLTWQEQAQRMQALNDEMGGLQVECETINALYHDWERPSLSYPDRDSELITPEEPVEGGESVSAMLQDQVETLQEQNTDLASRLHGVTDENHQLRQENAILRSRKEGLESSLQRSQRASALPLLSAETLEALDNMVEGAAPSDLLRLLAGIFPGRLRILDSAYESAARCTGSLPPKILYQRIKALATQGLDCIQETGRLIDLRAVVAGDIKVQESETVKLNPKLRAHRVFRDGDDERQIFTHLHLDHSHRLYFDYDSEQECIVIAYAGKHLPSAKHATV